MVRVHVTANLPIRVETMVFADRVEIRLGNAFPAVLVVEREALSRLAEAISEGLTAFDAAAVEKGLG